MVGLRKNLGLFSNFGLPGGGGIYELRQNKAYYAVLQVGIYEVGQKTCSTASKSCATSTMTNLQWTIGPY